MEDGLGARFWLKAAGLIVACGVGIGLVWLLLTDLFLRFGFIVAMVVVFGAVGLVAHRYDKKKQARYGDEL